jgi:lipopolysaccharide export system permease protein
MRLLRPVYALVLLLAAADFALVSYIQPFATYRYQQIRFDVTSGALGIRIPQGEFIDISKDTTIRLGKVSAATREVAGIFLEQRSPSGGKTIITANYGAIATTPDMSRLLLTMREGRQLIIDSKGERANALSFESLDVDIALPAIAMFRARGGAEDEATFGELWRFMRAGNKSDPLWDAYQAGFHWRLLHPLTFLVLPILAVAVGVTGRRKASSLKPIFGVALVIVYHEMIEEWGQVMVREGKLSPYVAMWGIFAAFLLASLLMYRGSIDRARTAKAMTRSETPVVRVLADAELDEETLDLAPQKAAQ